MTNILVVNASPSVGGSNTRALTSHAAFRLAELGEGIDIVYRDIGITPPPHLDDATIRAFRTPDSELTEEQRAALALSDSLITEVKAADIILIGVPLYNYGSPSALKAWFDQLVRPGKTIAIDDSGPISLLSGKSAWVITAVGGDFSPCAADGCLDQVAPYIASTLKLLGVEDIEFIHASGQAGSEDEARRGLARAYRRIDRLTEVPTLRKSDRETSQKKGPAPNKQAA